MLLKVKRSNVCGRVNIPGSKSHTIRAVFVAGLAKGKSHIRKPLMSNDTLAAFEACKAFGASVEECEDGYVVEGFGCSPNVPENIIDVGNSGTTLRLAIGIAALCDGATVFTGDYQIRRRPVGPLVESLNNLGAEVFSTRNNGMAPVVVKGKVSGGKTDLDSVTSQYLSSLLISLPLANNDSEIIIKRLNEVPYVQLTMWWLDKQGIKYENDRFKVIKIKGGQTYKPFDMVIPADFSSATFFMVLAAISGNEFFLENLDMSDPQGDKAVLGILDSMGAYVETQENGVLIRGGKLIGREIDMNDIPDALPAMAVAGCFAQGETKLLNVPQARLKETDRIRVMYEELSKMGADITELEDGLVIRNSKLKGALVKGHDDHRIVMALAIAGLNIEGETIIDTAEAINITFPTFVSQIETCGGNISVVNEK